MLPTNLKNLAHLHFTDVNCTHGFPPDSGIVDPCLRVFGVKDL